MTDPVIVLDGNCALCPRAARFIDRVERTGRLRIAVAGVDPGRTMMSTANLDPDDPVSWLFVDETGRYWDRSDAMIRVAMRLPFPWRMLVGLCIIPRGWRNTAYSWVAARRNRLFGQDDLCARAPPSLRARLSGEFLPVDNPQWFST